jgi:tetratricopeptide (TPR) repeat protein
MSSSFSDLEICLLNSESSKLSDIHKSIADLVENVTAGNFKEALESELAKELLTLSSDGSLEENGTPLTTSFRFEVSSLSDPKDIEACRLVIAAACLQAFLQENWTGPPVDLPVSALLSTSLSDKLIRAKSMSELALGGEPAYHLTKLPILLRISQLLLQLPYKYLITAEWWSRRAATVHQLILDEPVPFDIPTLESAFDTASQISRDLAGRIVLEEGLVHHHFGRDKEAFECFSRAAQVMGLEYEVTGALGVKTKFQDNPLSQLVLLARSRERGPQASDTSSTATTSDGKAAVPEALLLNDDTLLEDTKFTTKTSTSSSKLSDLDPSNQPALHPLDQCVLLGMCLNVRNTSPAHGLTSEQMMPYVTRVISNPKNWSIHTMALLLRSRLEATRTRTVERSTLQLQQLVEQMPSNDSSAKERLLYFHTLPLPSKWELERELALRYTSLGITKSALEIFERLEMWEEVVKCWGSMERPDKGVAIIQDLLAGRKQESEVVTYRSKATSEEKLSKLDSAREAKLWCLLGDLEPQNAEEHYQKAWIISGERSGRAIRSLGGYYFARNNFPEAIRCLRLAVAINPLLSRSWFILGCACVREEKWKDARDAFARCVAIDEEDAESWSNLASVYLRLDPGTLEDRNDDSVGLPVICISIHFGLSRPYYFRNLARTGQVPSDSHLSIAKSLHSERCNEVSNSVMRTGECGRTI